MQQDPHSHTPSPPSFRHLNNAGEFTPDISPLDEFINRGRLLSEQLGTSSRTGSPALTPLTVHASLRRTGRSPSPLSRSRTVGKESLNSPSPFLTVSQGDSRIAISTLEERHTSSYPRFSTVSTASTEDDEARAAEGDTAVSGATSFYDNNFALVGGFLNSSRSPPNLQSLQGRKGIEFEQVGRVGLKPVIVGSVASVETGGGEEGVEVSPRSGRAVPVPGMSGGYIPYQQGPQKGRGRDRRRGPEEEVASAAAYARSKSQPPPARRMPPRKYSGTGDHRPQHPQQPHPHHPHPRPVRKDSNGAIYPPRQDSTHKYRPYRQDSGSSGATSIGPLSRQGSAESEVFPPPQRQGSPSERLIAPLSRQGSAENEKFPGPLHRQGSDRLHPHHQDSRGSEHRMYPRSPNRQGSGQEGMKYIPYRAGPPPPLGLGLEQDRRPSLGEMRRPSRQDSRDGDRGRGVNRGQGEPLYHPGPQRPPTHSPAPMILPMAAGMRAASPESMTTETVGRDNEFNFGPPTPSYQFERPGSAASVSPSLCSVGGTPKPVFNFSRPLSNRPSIDTMRPTLDIPQRLTPEQSPVFPDEYSIPTPVSLSEEHGDSEGAAPTVVYSRFALPRGRMVDRNSVIFMEPQAGQQHLQPGQAVHQLQPQRPTPTRTQPGMVTSAIGRPPSPSSLPVTFLQPVPARDRAATYNSRSPSASPRLLLSPESRPLTTGALSPRSPRSPSNISLPPASPSATMSPDDHVAKGIALHESGSLQESTYHLRLAANGGHPTGMLLYALACRHGWGMKANPKEGVMWLKKVTELASSEVADDEMEGANVDLFEKKGRRAQFALSIYELGVSHMNGWGTEMDKGLAVRCFEIAGRWGDPDALAETGFCYANGVGCKKDMKKSAKFYRMAEAKGMNMPGNSWIWKDKYLDDEDRAAKKSKVENEKAAKKKK